MRMFQLTVVAAMIVLPFALGVKSAHAADTSVSLHLDSGFIGRPLHFDLFEGGVLLDWNDTVLTSTTTLVVTQDRNTSGAPVVHIEFSNPSAILDGSFMDLSIQQTSLQQGSLVMSHDGTDRHIRADVTNGHITGRIPVFAKMDIAVSSDVGTDVAEPIAGMAASGTRLVAEMGEPLELTLDSGFVGRDVSLDVFDGTMTIAWDAKTLVAPTRIRIARIQGGVQEPDQAAGTGVRFLFDDPRAVSQNGAIRVQMRADRPPRSDERVAILRGGSNAPAVFAKEDISATVSATSSADILPMYETGMMHSGLATWYRYKNCLCAASPDVPKGTKLKVSRQDDPTRSVIITVNDYGPDRSKFPDRVIDLDHKAFSVIGNPRGGTLAVMVEAVLPEEKPQIALSASGL